MTPEQITEERSRRLKSAFIDQDFGGAKALLDDNAFGGVVEDKEAFLTSSAVAGWAGVALGRRVNPAAPDWQGVKDGIARGFFKNQAASNVSDEDMFGMIAADYQAQDKVASAARMAAARGESWLGKFRELESKESGNMIPGRMANYIGLARAAHDEMAAKVAPYRSTIKTVAEMARNIDTAPDGMDWGAMASELIKVPKEDRPYVLEALSNQAAGEMGDIAAIQSLAKSFDRGLSRYLDSAASSALGVAMSDIEASAADNPFLTGAQSGEVAAASSTLGDYMDLRDDVRKIATGKLAQLKAVKFAGLNISGAVENIPMTMGSFIPYAGAAVTLASFQRSTYNEIRESNPTMSREDANRIATISAPIQAVTEIASDRFLFGKLPNLKRAFTQPIFSATGALSMFTTRAAIGTATEVSEEFIQGVTPLAVQYISKGLGADLPSTDWKGFFSDFANSVPELISTILPLAIVGAGTGQLSDFRAGRQMARSTDTLIAAQYSPESAARISELANAGKWSEAEDAMRTDWAKINAKGADVSQVKATAEQRMQAANRLKMLQKEQANVAELTTSPEYTASVSRTPSGWQVTTGDGTIIPAETAEGAYRIYNGLRQSGSLKEAQVFAETLDAAYASGMARGAAVNLTGETVTSDSRSGLVTAVRIDENKAPIPGSERYFGPGALDTIHKEAEVAGFKSGTQNVSFHINGSNEAFPSRVADTVKGIWRMINIFKAKKDGLPMITTFLHEDIESKFRLGLANGAWSKEDARTAFRALAPAFANIAEPVGKSADEVASMSKASRQKYEEDLDAKKLEYEWVKNVRKIVDGNMDDTLVRETFSEMYVRNAYALDRRGRNTGLPPGQISRALEAAVVGANTNEEASALVRIIAVFRALSAHLKAVFGTVKAMVKARDNGTIGEDWDAFVDKVLGIDEVKRDEGLAMNEAQAILEDSNMPFSISPAFSVSQEYWMNHRPNADGPRAFDLAEGGISPADVYDHPEWYSGYSKVEIAETVRQLKAVRGKPESMLTIYRASPKSAINSGDWVTLSKSYATTHAQGPGDGQDFKIWSAKVKASDVRWAMDDLMEFGYFGDDLDAANTGATFSISPAFSVSRPKKIEGTIDSFFDLETQQEIGTGKSVTFNYARNNTPAFRAGKTFGQDIEPAGRFMSPVSDAATNRIDSLEYGKVTFKSPLVLEWVGYGNDGWKARLSKAFGGKKGKSLSKAIVKDGYDGIITVSPTRGGQYATETVDLTMWTENQSFSVSVPTSDIDTIPEDLARAEADMKAGGKGWAAKVDLSQPVGVYRGEDGRLKLFDGHHRWLAARERGEPLQVRESVFGRAVPIGEAPVVADLPDGAQLVGSATFSITAYHGTPHKVDKFTTAKIGTGEGAQAYGWGLYFAQSFDVADDYRGKLQNEFRIGFNGKTLTELYPNNDEAAKLQSRLESVAGNTQYGSQGDGVRKAFLGATYGDMMSKAPPTPSVLFARQVEKDHGNFIETKTGGNIYTVELLPDEADFLDWDKPIAGQKSPKLDALKKQHRAFLQDPAQRISDKGKNGNSLYNMVVRQKGSEKAASEYLASLGISGIKYLDGNSRDGGSGTSNYVIFDESLVKILEENGRKVEGQSFSISPIRNLNELSDQVERQFAENPVKALEVKTRMIRQFGKIADKWSQERWTPQGNKIRPISDKRTVKSLDKEQAMRQAQREVELVNEGIDKLTPETLMAWSQGVDALDDHPLIQEMLGKHGKLMSLRTAQKEGKDIKDQYDDAPWIPPQWYAKSGGIMPDVMADNLKFGYAKDMWAEIESVIKTHRNAKEDYAKAEAAVKAVEKAAFEQARKEAQAWRDEADAMQKEDWSPKESLVRDLITLEAIVAMFPQEIRGKIGGFVTLARKASESARLKVLQKQLERGQVLLEKHLKEQYGEAVDKLFDKYRPTRKAGEKPKGKLDPDAQEIADKAESAMGLNADQTNAEIAAINTLLDADNISAEEEAKLEAMRELVQLLGDWKNADSARRESAFIALNDVLTEGWAKWKLKKIFERERRQELRDALISDIGKPSLAKFRDKQNEWSKSVFGKPFSMLLSISSFSELLTFEFGGTSKTARMMEDKERAAAYAYEDAMQELSDRIGGFFTDMAGGQLKGEQLRFDLAQNNLTIGTGDNERIISQLRGIQALLMWQQEDGRRHMEGPRDENGAPIEGKWSYDQAWIDELTSKLSPEALEIKKLLEQLYGEEWGPLNAAYRERNGVNLPRHDKYAPITVTPQQAKAGEMVDPVSGFAINGSILTPGSLRGRNKRAVAEPRFDDAIQIFLGHSRQMEHWKAYYDFATEAQAVLLNRDVMNAVESKGSKQAVTVLKKWVDTFAQGGNRDAQAGLEISNLYSRASGRAARIALFGRVSTIFIQSVQLAAASVKMPLGSYLKRLGMLASGQLDYVDVIKSPFMQRRYKTAPPIVQQSMADVGDVKRPNFFNSTTPRFLGNSLSGADVAFTSGTYAMILDYHRTVTGPALNLKGEELELYAQNEAERDTEAVAQPVRAGTRSIFENTLPTFAKTGFSFASEARQKISLFAWSAYKTKSDPAQAAKVAFLTFIVGGLFTQVIKNLWREAKDDDDEKMWSVERLVKATVAGPLHGVPGVSELTGDSGLFSGFGWSASAVKKITEKTMEDKLDEVTARDIENALSAAGYFNDTAAGVSGASHAVFDFAKVLENIFSEE